MCDEADFAAAEGGLGIDGGIVRHSGDVPRWQEVRRATWALSRTAAKLLYPAGTPKEQIKGVATCRWSVQSKAAGVDVHLSDYQQSGQRRASFGGLQTCGLVWVCPSCAARISETRRRQVNDGLAWAKAEGHRVVMMTLTTRHGAGDDLAEMLGALKEAKRRLHRHRRWSRGIKPHLVSMLTATEVTHGRNGWHPHYHVILILDDDEAEARVRDLGDAWRGALRAVGLDGAEAAFHVQDATAAGRYVGKWGAGEELTLGGKKKAGKGRGGRSPLQLLEAAKAGSEEAGNLWTEYAAAFRGRTQLDGLTALVRLAGLEEVSDEEAAQDEAQDGQDRDEEPLVNLDADTWRRRGRHRRTDILDAAEAQGAAGVWRIVEGPAAAWDLARPPPMRTGGLARRALAAIRSSQQDKSGGKPPAPPPSRSAAFRASGGAGGGVGPVQREGTVPGATHPPRSAPAGCWRRRRAGAENVTQMTVSERATTVGVE